MTMMDLGLNHFFSCRAVPPLDGRLKVVLLATLFLVGISTASTTVWYIFDPWLMRAFSISWLAIHSVYYIILAVAFLDLSNRILPLSLWPWKLLVSWLPVTLWSAASLAWSYSPEDSFYIWSYEVLLGAVFMIWGYSLGYRSVLSVTALKLVFFGILTYVSIRSFATEWSLEYAFGTTWFCIIFPLLLWWLSDECKPGKRSLFLILLLIFAVQGLVFIEIPQRMYMLTLFLTTILCGVLFYWRGIEPRRALVWRGALGAVALLTASLLFVLFKSRGSPNAFMVDNPASYLLGLSQDYAWYDTFLRSERWVIFGFWLQQGMSHVWTGVGLGPSLPRSVYGTAIAATDLQPIIAHAHNYFVNLWLQIGVVGLLCQLYLLGTVIRYSLEDFGGMHDENKRAAAILLMVFFAVFFRNLANDGFHTDNVIAFWLVIGFILGTQYAAREQSTTVTSMRGSADQNAERSRRPAR